MIALWALVVSARGGGRLWRAGPLTPYDAEVIGEDALRAGPGARLDLTVREETSEASCAQVRERFAWLVDRGVTVRVHRRRAPRRDGVTKPPSPGKLAWPDERLPAFHAHAIGPRRHTGGSSVSAVDFMCDRPFGVAHADGRGGGVMYQP